MKMKSLKEPKKLSLLLLIIAAVISYLLPLVPFGNYIIWPFVILTTYIHEMGHGLTAIIVGGSFNKLLIYSNASGTAVYSGVSDSLALAGVAAGGLLAPSIAGGIFILSGTSRRYSIYVCSILILLMLISLLFWVRSLYGFLMIGIMSMVLFIIATKVRNIWQQFLIQFLGVQMLADTLSRTSRYLFTELVGSDSKLQHSDTSSIALQLGGTYWLWGSLIFILCIAIFVFSIRHSYFK